MFTPGWKSLVRDGSYKLDNEQMDNLRQYIENHYLKKALRSHVIDLTSTDPEDDAGKCQATYTSSTINVQNSNGVHPTPSLPSLNNALDDISFLGPGQMPQSSDSSQFSIDLSMLGPGEVHKPSSEMPKSKGGRASLTENIREQASLHLNRRSHTPERPNSKNSQTKQDSEEEPSPDSTERKRLLSTWLSPSKKSFGFVATSAGKRSSSSAESIQRTSGSSPSTANRPQNLESKLSSSLTKVRTENGVDSGSAQQWVSSLFMKSDPKPSSKGRCSVKEPSKALLSGRRRGPYRKSGRSVQQGNPLP